MGFNATSSPAAGERVGRGIFSVPGAVISLGGAWA